MELLLVIHRHLVTNEDLPSCLEGEIILRKEGDVSDKLWDGDALTGWEEVENRGQEWSGRYQTVSPPPQSGDIEVITTGFPWCASILLIPRSDMQGEPVSQPRSPS